ncbi:HET-domain-containing protein [Xylaria castorea]|nr:HET-domain-containing protein [Xylaria castorea]
MSHKAPSAGTKVSAGPNDPMIQEGPASNADRKRACPPRFAPPAPPQHILYGGMSRETGGGNTHTAPSYVDNQFYRDPSGPHGKNIKEDDSIGTGDTAKNASFSAEIGSKDDPSLLAELIYHGVTGRGLSLLLWSGVSIQKDGPRDVVNKVQDDYLDSTFSFLVASYSLTHRASVLYNFREVLPLARTYYQLRYHFFLFITKAWDWFDYAEAQIVERLPRYLQHKWSSYRQKHPERAKLPVYRYKPLSAGEIRLLILKRSPFYPSVVQTEIVHRPIYPPPDYEAVSYRWGSAELTEEILVDGFRFPVTKAAFDVLLARRSVWRERIIWIDAICINQEDLQEKSEQVQLMRDIYHKASRVISVPGSDWSYRLAGAFVYQLVSISNDRSSVWRVVGSRRPEWVVQWCFQSSRRHMLTGSHDKKRRMWRPGRTFENVAVMTTLRPEAEDWTGGIDSFKNLMDLEKLLYLTFNFRAADPRDKVFGLIGIARSTGDAALITPDYSLSVEQVFQDTARVLFSLPNERRTVYILALAGTGFSNRSRVMPSWVPDFGEERICYPYSDISELHTGTRFRASGDLTQDLRIDDDDADSLVVKAITLDRILDFSEFGALDWGLDDFEVADIFKTIRIQHEFADAAFKLCIRHFKPSDTVEELISDRLWSALVGGLIERKPADVKFKDVFRYWWLNLSLVTSARDHSHYNQLIKDGALGDGWAFTADGSDTRYQYSVVEACFGRRMAITSSGRLCIVPPLTKIGDSVIIPLGSQTPFLIRERDGESEDVSYELASEAWVEGVMHGEMIGTADEEFIRIS